VFGVLGLLLLSILGQVGGGGGGGGGGLLDDCLLFSVIEVVRLECCSSWLMYDNPSPS
jgi:hypothetical protein